MSLRENDPRRWTRELRELRERCPGVRLVARDPHPTVEGEVAILGDARRFRLTWAAEHPLRPPSVWEINVHDGAVVSHRETGHAYEDGSLCLFAHTPEHGWSPEMTAATAIEKLCAFLEAIDRSAFPRVGMAAFETDHVRVSVPKEIARALRRGGRWGEVRCLARMDARMLLVRYAQRASRSAKAPESTSVTLPPSWVAACGLVCEWPGVWCRDRSNHPPSSRDDVVRAIRAEVPTRQATAILANAMVVLLVQDDASWLVYLNPPEPLRTFWAEREVPLIVVRAEEEDLAERLFLRVDGALSSRALLRAARVAMVGLGSLGSHVALSLAKSGVGRFALYDPEVLEPENVPRHVGSLSEIGLTKIEVVRNAILRVTPDAEVVECRVPLSLNPSAWSLDPGNLLHEVLRDPLGLVVCTTASEGVERIVNEACVRQRCPAVFGAVLGRAEHGRVFRVLPGETACYACVVLRQREDPGRHPRFEEEVAGARAYTQPGIPGLGVDVEQVALLTARMALQTLGRRVAGGIGYPDSHGHHLIWSNRGGWAVDGPLQTRVEEFSRHAECPVCGDRRVSPLTDDEEQELRAVEVMLCGG